MHLERAAEQLHVRLTFFKCKEGQTCGETSCQYEYDDRVVTVHRANSFTSEVAMVVVHCKKRVGLGEYSTQHAAQMERAVITPWSSDWSRVVHKGCHAFMNINITSRIIFSRSMNTENGFAGTTQHAHDPKKRSRQPDMWTIRQTRANHSRNKCLYSKSADHI
jgi:hypothetical protein